MFCTVSRPLQQLHRVSDGDVWSKVSGRVVSEPQQACRLRDSHQLQDVARVERVGSVLQPSRAEQHLATELSLLHQ